MHNETNPAFLFIPIAIVLMVLTLGAQCGCAAHAEDYTTPSVGADAGTAAPPAPLTPCDLLAQAPVASAHIIEQMQRHGCFDEVE